MTRLEEIRALALETELEKEAMRRYGEQNGFKRVFKLFGVEVWCRVEESDDRIEAVSSAG